MKHAKKLASLLLALVMLLALGTTAFAASNDGSITVTNATVGKSYSVYKVFDLTYDNSDPNDVKVAYTYTPTGDADAFLTALQDVNSPFTLTDQNNGKYTVTLKADKTAGDVSAFLNTNAAKLTAADTKTAADSALTFSGLAYGYYFVTSEVGTVLTIDSTLKDVNVIDKNQGPTWDNGDNPGEVGPGKVILDPNQGNADGDPGKVTENTVNYGDKVDFSIAINATSHVGDQEVTYYYITDTLDDGFNAAENIEVYVAGAKKTVNTDYTLTQNGNTFQVTVPHKAEYGANYKIEVKYSATVNNSAVLAGNGNKNTANFTYDTKAPGTPTTPDPKPTPTYPEENKRETTTYVYALGILKVDPKGTPLKGAEFSVKDVNGDTISAKGDNGVYEYCVAGTEGAVTQFKTNDKGVLTIKGLAAGTYTVTETVAPKGYNLLTTPVDVEAKLHEAYTETITVYKDADGNVTSEVTENTTTHTAAANVAPLVVVNQAGTELPSTGGMGTTLFYVLGGILAVGAVVLLVVKKRMSRAAQ